MLVKIMAIVEAIKALKYMFDKFESYVIKPLIKWYRIRQDKKIDKHYADKEARRERLKLEIESERLGKPTELSDEKLRQLMRKLKNLGESL